MPVTRGKTIQEGYDNIHTSIQFPWYDVIVVDIVVVVVVVVMYCPKQWRNIIFLISISFFSSFFYPYSVRHIKIDNKLTGWTLIPDGLAPGELRPTQTIIIIKGVYVPPDVTELTSGGANTHSSHAWIVGLPPDVPNTSTDYLVTTSQTKPMVIHIWNQSTW